jgi:hypothetical protein
VCQHPRWSERLFCSLSGKPLVRLSEDSCQKYLQRNAEPEAEYASECMLFVLLTEELPPFAEMSINKTTFPMTYHITSARLVISARLEPASSPLSVLVGTLLTDYSGLAPLPPDVHTHTRCATSAAATHVSLQRHIPVQVLLRKDS